MMKKIDIEQVIASKNPRLLKFLPGFALRYIKRIIHQDESNDFLLKNGHRYGIDFARAVIEYFEINLVLKGQENIPKTGGCIIASNHPLGGLDGIAFILAIGNIRPDIKFLVNDILMNIENLKEVFLPVNKHGRNTAEVLSTIDKAYGSGQAILIFPAGLVSRKNDGIIRDLEWKKSFIMQAKRHRLPVIPTFIAGENSKFFYNLANLRKKVGIGANIEMFYLVDEMFRQKGRTITITFDKPIEADFFDDTRSDKEWCDHVKEIVYSLKGTS